MPLGAAKAALLGAAGASGDIDEGGTYEWIAGTSWSSATTDEISFTSVPTSTYDDLEVRVGVAEMYQCTLVVEWNGYAQTTWNTHSFYSDGGTNYGVTAGSGSTNYPKIWGSQMSAAGAALIPFGDSNASTKHATGTQAGVAVSPGPGDGMAQVTGILANATAGALGTIKVYDKDSRNFPAGSSIHLFGIKTS